MPISTRTMSQILSGELFTAEVHNRPHNELAEKLKDINTHHNRDLIHTGEFTVTGSLTVEGTTVSISSEEVDIQNKRITVGSVSGNPQGGGFTVTESATGDDYWVKYDVLLNNGFELKDSRGTGEIVVLETSGEILGTPAISGDQAVTWSQFQSLAGGSSTSYSISSNYYEIPLSSGTHSISLLGNEFAKLDIWSVTGSKVGYSYDAAFGVQNNAICCGGVSASTYSTITQFYNGNTWGTLAGTMASGKLGAAGTGIVNSGLCFGGASGVGAYMALTEKFNGSVWSTTGSLNTASNYSQGVGRQNATLKAGGYNGISLSSSERFNGASWVTAASMVTARQKTALTGVQNTALIVYGDAPTTSNELYNGVMNSWSAVATGSISGKFMTAGFGTSRHCNVNGGSIGGSSQSTTEIFYGNSWKTSTDMNYARSDHNGVGSAMLGMVAGDNGTDSSPATISEKWLGRIPLDISVYVDSDVVVNKKSRFKFISTNGSNICIEILPKINAGVTLEEEQTLSFLGLEDYRGGAWVASTSTNTARWYLGGFGTPNATIIAVGEAASSEVYDGTSWSAGPDLSESGLYPGSVGAKNSGFLCGGQRGVSLSTKTELFDGTTWSIGNNTVNARNFLQALGSRNAALSPGGETAGSVRNLVEKFDGTSWSSTTNLTTSRKLVACTGFQNACFVAGGTTTSTPLVAAPVEIFNGTAWSTSQAMPTGQMANGATGTIKNGFVTPYTSRISAKFNGLWWVSSAGFLSSVYSYAYCGTANAAYAIAGNRIGASTGTEKFNSAISYLGSLATITVTSS